MDLSTEQPVVVLKARRVLYALLLIMFGLMDVFAIALMAVFRESVGWAIPGVLGLMTAVVAVIAWSPGQLTLDPLGFTLTQLGMTTRRMWSDVDRLGIVGSAGPASGRKVGFRLTEQARKRQRLPSWVLGPVLFGGFDGALYGHFGMSPEELVSLMEKIRSGREVAP